MNQIEFENQRKHVKQLQNSSLFLQVVVIFTATGALLYEGSINAPDIFCNGNWFIFIGVMTWMAGTFLAIRANWLDFKLSSILADELWEQIKKDFEDEP